MEQFITTHPEYAAAVAKAAGVMFKKPEAAKGFADGTIEATPIAAFIGGYKTKVQATEQQSLWIGTFTADEHYVASTFMYFMEPAADMITRMRTSKDQAEHLKEAHAMLSHYQEEIKLDTTVSEQTKTEYLACTPSIEALLRPVEVGGRAMEVLGASFDGARYTFKLGVPTWLLESPECHEFLIRKFDSVKTIIMELSLYPISGGPSHYVM